MAVYVDALKPCPMTDDWRWPEACHLFADTTEELHAFALRLGMRRSWFQDDPRLPHYDLTPRRRRKALYYGAKEMPRLFVKLMMERNLQKDAERLASQSERRTKS